MQKLRRIQGAEGFQRFLHQVAAEVEVHPTTILLIEHKEQVQKPLQSKVMRKRLLVTTPNNSFLIAKGNVISIVYNEYEE